MWATALGRDLYQLLNIPFNLYGLNYRDVVRATRHRAHDDPEIRFVVRRSGHRTLRVVFAEDVPTPLQIQVLGRLKPLGVGFEGSSCGFYALDLAPEGDLDVVCGKLSAWRGVGLLDCYETADARRAGSFDLPRLPGHRRVLPQTSPQDQENSEQ